MKLAKKLERQIRKAAVEYYSGTPIMHDNEFDNLCRKLQMIEPKNPILHRVGYGYNPKEHKVKHWFPIEGLQKIFQLPETLPKAVEAKLDGITVVVYYTKGQLAYALTRGDGNAGLDITARLLKTSGELGIPFEVGYEADISVRGELVCPKEHLPQMIEAGYATTRSAVALVFNKEEMGLEQYLQFCPFSAVDANGSHVKIPKEFKNQVPRYPIKTRKLNMKQLDLWRKRLSVPTDGVVLLDLNGNRIALKFETEEVKTRIEEITWEMSGYGRLIPVANVSPTMLYGTSVTRASLYNHAYVEEKGFKLEGAEVMLTKSNEIIPMVSRVTSLGKKILPPESCPFCHRRLVVESVHLLCANPKCPRKINQRVKNFILRAFTFEGSMGDSYIQRFLEEQGITSFEKFCRWVKENRASRYESIVESSRKSISAIGNAIVAADKDGIDRGLLLYSLSIPSVGETLSKALAPKIEDIIQGYYGGITQKVAVSKIHASRDIIAHALATFKWVSDEPKSYKMSIVITGELSVARKHFIKLCEKEGIHVASSVTKTTKFLVDNGKDSLSSKARRANTLGVPKITEEEFKRRYFAKRKRQD